MSADSFLAMLGTKETAPAPKPEPVKVPRNNDVSELTTIYNYMYDKPKHHNTIRQTYWYVIQRPPEGVDPVVTAEAHLLSLTEAELEQVMLDLKLQMPEQSSADVNLVKEFKKLDEMAQYKFFCKVRDMFDDEDWATLTDKE